MTSVVMRAASSRLLDRMYREHNPWLLRWIRSRNRSAGSVDDIASEVFVRLVAMDDITTIREPRAMMTTIARHVMIELFRRNQLRRAYEAELAALPETAVASPEHQMIVLEALQTIDKLLLSMSVKARTAFLMSQIDGMKYADIAKEVGVSVSMVRKYIAQGLLRFYDHHPNR